MVEAAASGWASAGLFLAGIFIFLLAITSVQRGDGGLTPSVLDWLIAKMKSQPKGKVNRRSFMVDLLLSTKKSRDFHANLDEIAPIWKRAHGRRKAEWLRRREIVVAVLLHLMTPVLVLWEQVRKFI
ncbi:hypothetical protein ASE22_22305 [Sphingomonas sp. Root720]|nr:hypothetical protein ASE22_22305 [Sphingomonas sp. Root720]